MSNRTYRPTFTKSTRRSATSRRTKRTSTPSRSGQCLDANEHGQLFPDPSVTGGHGAWHSGNPFTCRRGHRLGSWLLWRPPS
jgi:hypothetical protein